MAKAKLVSSRPDARRRRLRAAVKGLIEDHLERGDRVATRGMPDFFVDVRDEWNPDGHLRAVWVIGEDDELSPRKRAMFELLRSHEVSVETIRVNLR